MDGFEMASDANGNWTGLSHGGARRKTAPPPWAITQPAQSLNYT